MSNDLSISKLAGDAKSSAADKYYQFRQSLQQKPHKTQNVGPGSLSDRLANFSSYTVDTSCARPTNQ